MLGPVNGPVRGVGPGHGRGGQGEGALWTLDSVVQTGVGQGAHSLSLKESSRRPSTHA